MGNEPEAARYVAVKRAQDSKSNRRKPVGIALTALRGSDNFFGQDFLVDRRRALG